MRVRALALGAVATATQRGVVAPSQALEAQTLAALQSTVGTLATACHNKLLLESGEEFQFLAKWSVSSPMALGETPTLAVAKADIYINTRIKCQGFC